MGKIRNRWITAVLGAILLLAVFGCSAPAEQIAAEPADAAQAEPETTAAPTPTVTTEPELPEETAAREAAIDIEDIVVIDDGRMCISVRELYPEEPEGCGIGVEIENRTEDTWSVSLAFTAVNGMMTASDSGCMVEGGQTVTDRFIIPRDELAAYGIVDFTDIVLTFNASNVSAQPTMNVTEGAGDMPVLSGMDATALIDWFMNSNFHCGPVHICPYGEEKVSLYVREPQADDRVLFESDAARVTVFGGAFDADGGYSVQFYLENLNPLAKTVSQKRTDLVFSVFNPTANGVQLLNNIVNANVEQRSAAYLTAAWTTEDLAAAGIDKIKTLEVLLDVRNTDDGTVYTNETVKLLP